MRPPAAGPADASPLGRARAALVAATALGRPRPLRSWRAPGARRRADDRCCATSFVFFFAVDVSGGAFGYCTVIFSSASLASALLKAARKLLADLEAELKKDPDKEKRGVTGIPFLTRFTEA